MWLVTRWGDSGRSQLLRGKNVAGNDGTGCTAATIEAICATTRGAAARRDSSILQACEIQWVLLE